jgi:O-antigen/teichoic acid export membrane protein
MTNTFREVFKNTLFQSIGKIVTLALSIYITKVLASSLQPSGYGDYTFITAFILLFGVIADWGTNIISVREASRQEDKQPQIFGTSTLFRLILSLSTILLANIIIRSNPQWSNLVFPTFVASGVLVALSLKTSFGIVFQTLLRYEYSSIVEIISSISFLFFVLLAVKLNFGLVGVLSGWVLATLIAALLGLLLSKKLTSFEWKLDLKIIKAIFWQALPAGALFIVFTIYNRIDTIFLEHYWGSSAVGLYGLAYKVHDNLVLGAAFLMNSMFPYIARSYNQKDWASLKSQYQKAFDLIIISSTILLISVFIFAPSIIKFLGGDLYEEATPLLRLLVIATTIAYFNHLTGYTLIALGKQKSSLYIALGALVLNIIANFVFVPVYSYVASSIITIATEGFVLVLSSIAVARAVGFAPSLTSFPKTLFTLIKTRTLNI